MVIVLLFSIMSGTPTNAQNNNIEQPKLSIDATEKQLHTLNNMDLETITIGELMKKVFPEEFNKLNIETQKQMDDTKYYDTDAIKNTDDFEMEEMETSTLAWGSELSNYGNSLKYLSFNNPSFTSKEMWIMSELRDSDTRDIVNFQIVIDYWVSYLEAGNIIDPPTGTYYTYGVHFWMYKSGPDWIWLNLTSSSTHMSYVNPYY